MKSTFPLRDVTKISINKTNKVLPVVSNTVEIPMENHPGSFGFVRKNHTHEGVDLYTLDNALVVACEPGIFMGFHQFTGERVGSPWWNTTYAAIVKHEKFYAVYGEIIPFAYNIPTGYEILPGYYLGWTTPVLKKDKGRPRIMLHFELYDLDWDLPNCAEWSPGAPRPRFLLDPTDYLLGSAKNNRLLTETA